MITLKFVRSDDIEIHRAGPYPWVRVANGVLQAGPDGADVAQYRGGIWSVEGGSTTRCIVQSEYGDVQLLASEEALSRHVATSQAIEFIDGSIYAHPQRRLVATLRESEHRWLAVGKTWSAVVVETAQRVH